MEINLKIKKQVTVEENTVVDINLIENEPVCFFAHDTVWWCFLLKDNGLIKITIAQTEVFYLGNSKNKYKFTLSTIELTPDELHPLYVEILTSNKEGYVKISHEAFLNKVNELYKTYILQ